MTEIKENDEDLKTFCMVVGILGLLALFLYFMTTTSLYRDKTECTELWPANNSTEYSSCMPFINYTCEAGYICVPQVQGGEYKAENVLCQKKCIEADT